MDRKNLRISLRPLRKRVAIFAEAESSATRENRILVFEEETGRAVLGERNLQILRLFLQLLLKFSD